MRTPYCLMCVAALLGPHALGCSSTPSGVSDSGGMHAGGAAGSSASGASGSLNGGAGSSGSAGNVAPAGAAGTQASGGTGPSGGTGGLAPIAGTAGIDTVGGSGGSGGSGGTAGIGQDIPPWRGLGITVPMAQHTHTTPAGKSAGMDNRAAKMAGKLVVDLGVDAGGYQQYLGKRGLHVIGADSVNACGGINDWTLGRDFDGDCRLNTLDGKPHGTQNKVTPQQSVMNQVLQALLTFEAAFPGEGWGYFLTQDSKAVRWSDVAFTGLSHGAQSAVCFATELRVWRAVPQSGPRDNTCGYGVATGPYDPTKPPFDVNCPASHIASWIDGPSATPIDRYFGFAGGNDAQYGDILFTMQRMKFVGDFVNIDTVVAPYGGSHRFYSLAAGHNSFPNGFPIAAINIAFDVPPENQNPKF